MRYINNRNLSSSNLKRSTSDERVKILDDFIKKPYDVVTSMNEKYDVVHPSYAFYLHLCYAKHYGVVISPDFLWFTALNTFAREIALKSEEYRQYFVDFEGKKTVKWLQPDDIDDNVRIFVEKAMDEIKLPLMVSFSTSTPMSDLASKIVFTDIISPYIQGMILSCGIPFFEVRGKDVDYDLMGKAAENLAQILKTTRSECFFSMISKRAYLIRDYLRGENDGNFFKNFFNSDNCSPGNPVYEINGWFNEFLAVRPKRYYNRELFLKDDGLNCGIAKFKYEYKPKELWMLAGIFGSTYNEKENLLEPHFDRVSVEVNQ
jgi:hypothetical protein